VDKSTLLARRLPTGEVEIPEVGTITVRGLSLAEMLLLRGEERLVMDRKTLAWAMVDPALTEDEAAQWQQSATAYEIEAVTAKISELSGITKTDAKEAYKSVRDQP